jgi:nucleoside-diphosphate-sugar epimerase
MIVGCGYVGKAFARRALEAGYEAAGLKRDISTLADLPGLVPMRADITDPKTLKNLPKADTVIFSQAPTQREGGPAVEPDGYRKTYFEGTRNVLAVLKKNRPSKLVFISSTSVYPDQDGGWVNENTPAGGDADAETLLRSERLVLDSGIPAVVLRLAGIYGPERNRIRSLREGKLAPLLNDAYSNRIHIEDIVSALMILLMNGKPGEIYIGCDDKPATQREFYEWLLAKLGVPVPAGAPPSRHSRHGGNKRCSNAKLRSLGWSPAYPSYIEGYGAILRGAKN